MSRRRSHGRIASVETMVRGGSLDVDAVAGATSLTVTDAGDFDEDGGWIAIGAVLSGGEWDYSSAQLVKYVADDDTGILTLTDPLTAAAEAGDPVHLWDPLYEEAVEFQEALVVLDGDYDNPEEIVAEVAEGVGTLPEGDRGRSGESCTLKRVSEDEWEVVAVGGRSRKSQRDRWEQDDAYTLTAADITAASATLPLSHRPNAEALTCVLAGVPQRPTAWSIDYNAQRLTVPLSGWEQAGDVLWVHYAYRKGLAGARATIIPYSDSGWRYKQVPDTEIANRSTEDPATWGTASAPFGNSGEPGPWAVDTRLWLQRDVPAADSVTVSVKVEDHAEVYANGNLIGTIPYAGVDASHVAPPTDFDVPAAYTAATWTLAVLCIDEEPYPDDYVFVDVEVTGRLL